MKWCMPLIPVFRITEYWDLWGQLGLRREFQASQDYKVTLQSVQKIKIKLKLDIIKDRAYWLILTLEINFERVTPVWVTNRPVSTSLPDNELWDSGLSHLDSLKCSSNFSMDFGAPLANKWPRLAADIGQEQAVIGLSESQRMHRMGTGWDWAPRRKLIPQQQAS